MGAGPLVQGEGIKYSLWKQVMFCRSSVQAPLCRTPRWQGWCCWLLPTSPGHPTGKQNPNVRLCCDPVLQHQVGFQGPCLPVPLCPGSLSTPLHQNRGSAGCALH